jgi:hypothetical protein
MHTSPELTNIPANGKEPGIKKFVINKWYPLTGSFGLSGSLTQWRKYAL